jgi:alkaline phosphatase
MIGDGMGPAQIAGGMYSTHEPLHLERISNLTTGLHKNTSADDLVTDSAAGATAFACGKKTYNGAIGVDVDTMPLETILEEAQDKGYRTGLVATSTIVHATPASFASHNRLRKNYEEIALDMSDSNVDVMIGGGAKFFREREDERDLYEEMRSRGYYVSDYFARDFEADLFSEADKLMYLTARDSPLQKGQGRDYLPMASQLTVEHLDRIAGDDGFFAMIEGSQIDWGGHANKDYYIVSEMLDFDEAIGAVAEWAAKDGETLVVITADHETGGFAINKGSVRGDTLVTGFTSDYHTATLIPVMAFGPGSERFTGIYENTEIYHKIRAALGWD